MTHTFCFASWNTRGLGDKLKCDDVLSELTTLKPSIACLQETKLADVTQIKSAAFLPRTIKDFHFKPSNGTAGGILTAISPSLFSLVAHSHHEFTLNATIRINADNSTFHVTNVYAPTDHSRKNDFLQELAQHKPPDNEPWIILGDFNLMRSHADKNNDNFRQHEADAFNDAIHALALTDLPLLDRCYTWSNNRANPTLQRLDRVFINNPWAHTFPNTSLSTLTRFVSDHVPLIVHVSTTMPHPTTFCFENSWASLLRPSP